MAGPSSESQALRWIQEALSAGRYVPSVHFQERLLERRLNMDDVFQAVENASSCTPYERREPVHGGTCWRVIGRDVDGTQDIAIGVEAFLDKKKRRCVLCTIFRKGED